MLHLSYEYFQIVINTISNAQRTHTFAIRTSQCTNQKLQKSVPYPTQRREKKKHESTTKAIRNAGFSSTLKVTTFNVLLGKLKVKCHEIPHYS